MKKLVLTIFALLFFVGFSNAQTELNSKNKSVKIDNKVYSIKSIDDCQDNIISFIEYKDGKIWQTGEYLDGRMNGTWRQYNEMGEPAYSVEYRNGAKVSRSIIVGDTRVFVRYKNNELSKLIVKRY